MKALLENGAHPDDGGDKVRFLYYTQGWTPLFIAAGEGHLGVVQLLLSYDANPNEQSAAEGEKCYTNNEGLDKKL